jgi:hypothetical protein
VRVRVKLREVESEGDVEGEGELLCPSPSINFSHAFLINRDSILFPRSVHPEG